MTEHEWDQLKDRELDNSLGVLFRSAGALAPLPGFTSRTLKAVRRAPLPAGRRALRHPLVAPISWTVLIAAAAGALAAVVAAHPAVGGPLADGGQIMSKRQRANQMAQRVVPHAGRDRRERPA